MSEQAKQLVMSFDPKTIEHLGIKMYSQLPNAIAELIANAYDADAKTVRVDLRDKDKMSIIVADDGIGMTYNEINDKFLRIGRNRREAGERLSPRGRTATGKKGLGKLAFFGIGKVITVQTRHGGAAVEFRMCWDELTSTPAGQDYKPKYQVSACSPDDHGTTVSLEQLKRTSPFDPDDLADSLAKLFHFPDEEFSVILTHNTEGDRAIDNKLKYEGLETEFEWTMPEFAVGIEAEFKHKTEIRGKIITTSKPLRAGMRGITLFANGRMVNRPEFFGVTESSHFFSYATGWLDVDFVDGWEADVISTNRQSLDWGLPPTEDLKNFLQTLIGAVHRDWRERRQKHRRDKIAEKTKIDVESWYKTLPPDIETKVSALVKTVVETSELPVEGQKEAVAALHFLVPEYPLYHWRHLHKDIQDASKSDYEKKDYYRAFQESAKRYITKTREKSGSKAASDGGMMGEVYGRGKQLSVTSAYKKPDGGNFSPDTLESIEDGQKHLSMGIVAGGRNPVSHEEIADLRDSGLFSEKDCLDGLSLLSHLIRRLQDAK